MNKRHSHYSVLMLLLAAMSSLCFAYEDPNRFDCSSLATEEPVVDGGLEMVQSFLDEFGEIAIFDDE